MVVSKQKKLITLQEFLRKPSLLFTKKKLYIFYFNDYRSKPTISRHRNITKISTFVKIINSLSSIQ